MSFVTIGLKTIWTFSCQIRPHSPVLYTWHRPRIDGTPCCDYDVFRGIVILFIKGLPVRGEPVWIELRKEEVDFIEKILKNYNHCLDLVKNS
jgi:hypothetical protein